MNYYEKYIKYKTKYLRLKGGGKSFQDIIDECNRLIQGISSADNINTKLDVYDNIIMLMSQLKSQDLEELKKLEDLKQKFMLFTEDIKNNLLKIDNTLLIILRGQRMNVTQSKYIKPPIIISSYKETKNELHTMITEIGKKYPEQYSKALAEQKTISSKLLYKLNEVMSHDELISFGKKMRLLIEKRSEDMKIWNNFNDLLYNSAKLVDGLISKKHFHALNDDIAVLRQIDHFLSESNKKIAKLEIAEKKRIKEEKDALLEKEKKEKKIKDDILKEKKKAANKVDKKVADQQRAKQRDKKIY